MTDDLAPFRDIAHSCSAEDAREILADCEHNPDPVFHYDVAAIYRQHLRRLSDREAEIDYWEDRFH